MCSRVVCRKCQKYTWAGCGNHIPSVFMSLSKDQICICPKTQDTLRAFGLTK